jgi:hypothetical protein
MSPTHGNTLNWKKSSHSGVRENCVEVAGAPEAVAMRDSKDPDGPALLFSRAAFASFLRSVRA